MDEIFINQSIIETTLNNFNFAFIISVNILTYILISLIDILNKNKTVTFWQKRGLLLLSIGLVSIVYFNSGEISSTVLLNSAIAAPVFWSWVIKPILSKTKYDYRKIDKYLKN